MRSMYFTTFPPGSRCTPYRRSGMPQIDTPMSKSVFWREAARAGTEGVHVPVDLLEEIGVLVHQLGDLAVVVDQTFDVVGVALGVDGDLRGNGVGSLGRDE